MILGRGPLLASLNLVVSESVTGSSLETEKLYTLLLAEFVQHRASNLGFIHACHIMFYFLSSLPHLEINCLEKYFIFEVTFVSTATLKM